MNEASEKDPEIVRQKLNQDTAKIKWGALHEHQQIECVVAVSTDLDLIDVACEFTFDNHPQVKTWLEQRIEDLMKTAEQTVQTEGICKLFNEKDLLATQQLQLQHRQDSPRYNIDGVYSVDEKKLNALSDDDFLDLRKQGMIPLIYAHLSSLQQLRRVSEMQYNADKTAEAST